MLRVKPNESPLLRVPRERGMDSFVPSKSSQLGGDSASEGLSMRGRDIVGWALAFGVALFLAWLASQFTVSQ